jgi:hypothetical protein
MAWAANINSIEFTNGNASVQVAYVRDSPSATVTDTYNTGDPGSIPQTIQNRLAQLQSVDDWIAANAAGPVAPAAAVQPATGAQGSTTASAGAVGTAAPAPPVTPIQALQGALANLRSVMQLVTLGVLQATDPNVTAAQAVVSAAFDPSLIGQF